MTQLGKLTLIALLSSALLLSATSVSAAPVQTADPSNAAWAAYRAATPAAQPLYRPTWLPDRFQQPGAFANDGLIFGVRYASERQEAIIFGSTGNFGSCPADASTQEPVLIHGLLGTMQIPSNRERSGCILFAYWQEANSFHRILTYNSETSGLSRAELLLIIAGLAPVAPDGRPIPGPMRAGQPNVDCFSQTNHCIAGPFRDYWQQRGALAQFGYPLTGEMLEQLEDGQLYQVQYFERARMEFHPVANTTKYNLLLGQFGRRIHGQVDPPVAPAPGATFFRETGHNLSGSFRDYWTANGGLTQFGYPITEEFTETLEDGQPYTVQYFERARFEHHPANPAPYDILLGQFGRRILSTTFDNDSQHYQQATAPRPANGSDQFFPETGHNVSARFFAYWQAHGDLAQFGYPLTEPFAQQLSDGNTYQVQYFERARFEYHPENAAPYDILLGQFGRQILNENALLSGDLRTLYVTSELVRTQLGAPLGPTINEAGAWQSYQRGVMFYLPFHTAPQPTGPVIISLCGNYTNDPKLFFYLSDTWTEGQDPGGGPSPNPETFYPQRGFNKVWQENPAVQQCLGYATSANEISFTIDTQPFQGGTLLNSNTPEGHYLYLFYYIHACPDCLATGFYERFTPAR